MANLIFIYAIPYAGITRVRFKGYNLSHQWHPYYKIYYINPQKAICLIIKIRERLLVVAAKRSRIA
jgi:hypothetical protein